MSSNCGSIRIYRRGLDDPSYAPLPTQPYFSPSPACRVGCYERGNGRIYRCGLEYLDDESRYATWLRPWLDNFPREQLYVIQVGCATAGMP